MTPGEKCLLRVVLSLVVAAAFAAVLWLLVPNQLTVSTDIVGYPIFSDFDIYRYVYGYYFIAFLFPLLVIGFLQLTAWKGPLRFEGTGRPAMFPLHHRSRLRFRPPGIRSRGRRHAPWWRTCRRECCGARVVAARRRRTRGVDHHHRRVLDRSPHRNPGGHRGHRGGRHPVGESPGQSTRPNSWPPPPTWLPCSSSPSGSGSRTSRKRTPPSNGRFDGSGIAGPVQLAGGHRCGSPALPGVALDQRGCRLEIPPRPLSLASLVAVTLLTLLCLFLGFAATSGRKVPRIPRPRSCRSDLGRRPVLLFLVVAVFPGAIGAVRWLRRRSVPRRPTLVFNTHSFPWRDVYVLHGLLADVFDGKVGMVMFGNARWRADARLDPHRLSGQLDRAVLLRRLLLQEEPFAADGPHSRPRLWPDPGQLHSILRAVPAPAAVLRHLRRRAPPADLATQLAVHGHARHRGHTDPRRDPLRTVSADPVGALRGDRSCTRNVDVHVIPEDVALRSSPAPSCCWHGSARWRPRAP